MVGWGEAARLPVGTGPGRFDAARDSLAGLAAYTPVDDPLDRPGTGLVATTSWAFEDDGPSVLSVPATVVGSRGGQRWVTAIGPPGDPRLEDPSAALPGPAPVRPHGRVRYAGASQSELAWLDAVARATAEIRDHAGGEPLTKVVLARDRVVWAREPFDTRLLLQRLADRFPSCFVFAIDGLVGATPELLIGRDGRSARSLVLAGTAPRGRDEVEDAELGARLLASAKDRDEHRPSVDSVREAFDGIAEDLAVDPEPWLLRLANVQHLATDVRVHLREPAPDLLELAARLHPPAAVCGSPRDAARATIRRLEQLDRGRYAAPVGWVDPSGDGELGIALRCAEVDGARARLFAGAGIVAGSLPEAELEETRHKLRAMQSAIEG
ncbi:isochorismate synthase [Egibacter rhizosphaerae]|uniref:isochorismate synthase n=2 Tax=Egibacter rhizosphaerae TaxID=1670831 RepID=A0A411YLE8_9ACTN|nr:isochorismate synthase [Egibacter rhizosphaerae]